MYTSNEKTTPKIIIEVKKPKRKDGIEQLRSYINSEGSPVGVWSNGSDRVILYRPYPKDFSTLPEIPKKDETPEDIEKVELTLADLERSFNFKKILLDLEELVLGSSGVNVFNEIFKIIFAKIWDEKEASDNADRKKKLHFKWFQDADLTYDRINGLFKKASEEWPGIFDDHDKIKLQKEHLNVCIAPLERTRFLGSNLRIMDDAFEYLLPTEAKKKKGQFFTPRYVIDMCVRMLNPKRNEYVLDPACGSAGFLVHAMAWAYPASTPDEMELRKSRYASKYLWGIDFEEQAAKTSRALMLIAGDGHSNIFGPDVDTLEPRTWYRTVSGRALIQGLRSRNLSKKPIPSDDIFKDEDEAWNYFEELKFDLILSNPPFAGEVKVTQQLRKYELAKPALKRAKDKQAKEERDVLFIERIIKMLKPGGRAAIVLPQGKFNNSSLAFIREWILRKARLLAVVGLHQNTFKPHTGTKTSVLLIQKYTRKELSDIEKVKNEVKKDCPNYTSLIDELLSKENLDESMIPEDLLNLILEELPELEMLDDDGNVIEKEDYIESLENEIFNLKSDLIKSKEDLINLDTKVDALIQKQKDEIKVISDDWEETKTALREHLKPIKIQYKADHKELKEQQKSKRKELRKLIKNYEDKLIPQAEYELQITTLYGQLNIIKTDDDLIQTLCDRFIDKELADRLNYPIFMAVSEDGGKDNSGEYIVKIKENGDITYDKDGNPLFKQDLVNYDLTSEDYEKFENISESNYCIAEAFIKFAKENNFDFWSE